MELVEARRPVEIAMQIRGVAIATPGVQNVRGRSREKRETATGYTSLHEHRLRILLQDTFDSLSFHIGIYSVIITKEVEKPDHQDEIKMYKELSVSNFRTLKNVDVRNFGDINIITGGNGTGKSTLLEAIFLNAGANNTPLALSLNRLRGDDEINRKNDAVFHSLFHDLDASEKIQINSRYMMPNSRLVSRDLEIKAELEQKRSDGETGVDVFVNGLSFYFSSKTPKAKKAKTSKGNIYFDKSDPISPIKNSKVDPSVLLSCRLVSPMAPAIHDISERISTVIKTKEMDQVVELLRIIDPRISDITSINEHGRNQVYVDIGLDNLLPATYMGGGFIRLLNLAISMSRDSIILIDEIENGLHHSTHEPLLDFLFQTAVRLKQQVFITTHSSEFLDEFIKKMKAFENLSVSAFRCFRDNKAVSIKAYTEEELGLKDQLNIELR